jgi:hypothetical protein
MSKSIETLVILVVVAGAAILAGVTSGVTSQSVAKKAPTEDVGSRETTGLTTLLNGVGATTTGQWMSVNQFRFLACSVDVDNAATVTIKFAGSLADSAPTASTAQSSTNQYSYLSMTDIETNTSTNGIVGVVFNSALQTGHKTFQLNTNGLQWFTAIASPWVAGTSTVSCKPFSG